MLAGVKVALAPPLLTSVTTGSATVDSTGSYEFETVAQGAYTILIRPIVGAEVADQLLVGLGRIGEAVALRRRELETLAAHEACEAEAIAFVAKASAAKPEETDLLFTLGSAYERAGDHAAARLEHDGELLALARKRRERVCDLVEGRRTLLGKREQHLGPHDLERRAIGCGRARLAQYF